MWKRIGKIFVRENVWAREKCVRKMWECERENVLGREKNAWVRERERKCVRNNDFRQKPIAQILIDY